MSNENPVVAVAKERETDGIVTLSTGVRARIVPVSPNLIDAVTSRIPDPEIPVWHNQDKGRDEPNPNDPQYRRELAQAERRRGLAGMDAMIMFGVILVDGVPSDGEWLAKLRKAEKFGLLDLSDWDFSDPDEVEFLYKKFVAVSAADLNLVGRKSGITQEDVDRAEGTF